MRFVYLFGNVVIFVDGFSLKEGVIPTAVLDETKPIVPQLYECLSGNHWDKFMEKFDREMREHEVKDGNTSVF